MGTPVITIKHGGAMELVKDNLTGVYIDIKEIRNLDKTINNLYEDKQKLNTMYDNCLKERKNMIHLEEYCKKLIEYYQEICLKKESK